MTSSPLAFTPRVHTRVRTQPQLKTSKVSLCDAFTHAFKPRPTPRVHTRVHTQTQLKASKVHLNELQRKV